MTALISSRPNTLQPHALRPFGHTMKTNLSNPWHSLLKECYRRPHPLCLVSSRSYARNNGPRKEIAVLGSGITGLTAAYNLSQKLPEAHITLYEASSRVSGWIQSSHVDVKGGKVIFEQGPRTLRPGGASGMATLDLVSSVASSGNMS